MSKYVYNMDSTGRATDLRFVPDSYVPASGEIISVGDELPGIDSLHTQQYNETRESDERTAETKCRLTEIDLKSIRSLREWLCQQPDAPQYIRDHEAAAVAERAKLPK